ncbi:MAG: hypothetical protein H0W25_19455, partial [Acidimicrobiia bacterium]|nr:hypothetical protein [Acidimicrobiia bacterium]
AGSAGLAELVATSNALGLPVRLRVDDEVLASLPPAVAASTHRIVQESLTNARRHGHDVTAVDVVVDRVDGALQIVVHDDGRPTTRGRGEIGYGLVGMAERSAALGGTFTAGRDERGGWTVVATIPVEATG